ncbi:hypothetical protein K402DRAFT_334656 [Aulographum hederae CBS 113979]|uniref:Galactose oxidase n=1 Tax=Aulographum hederae CBS 113979 TaxID=1176131 RepID=A0A6G1GXG1_9PEZI|nr:hypothetical protein K402DRAFT_334656 [Aulographum hederae CBS 113979]
MKRTLDIHTIPPRSTSTSVILSRVILLACVLLAAFPIINHGSTRPSLFGVSARTIDSREVALENVGGAQNFTQRQGQDDRTQYCKRWSHQSAVVNGTMYIYGGRSSYSADQTQNQWNNDFLTLDLTKSWTISSPSLTSLAQPSGPPPVANGYLWNSHSSLYLYGGEFQDQPATSPVAFSMWEYDIAASSWKEHSDPQTSAGLNSEGDGGIVERAAEGAGFGVASLGRGWYFGGHLDAFTTEGWDWYTQPRVYLKSLLEFTFPGATNLGVQSLNQGQTADSDGAWRNITTAGDQDTAVFGERADGVLVYIPGFGAEGVLLGLAGGTNESFTQMNIIDVYDIANATWYKQTTNGDIPDYRVNPCAVVAAAADGSSHNVYMFGGQNLLPYGSQTQKQDMWVLSVPSFTWIEVDQQGQVPYGRSGHSCQIWDGQMVMVGGYIGRDIGCEYPGIYVFNTSSLSWENQFTSLTGQQGTLSPDNGNQNSDSSGGSDGDGSEDEANPFSQQQSQIGFNSSAGLEGSYGYLVPPPIASIIGGSALGGASQTTPVNSPTSGPMATGRPNYYTVTAPGTPGATVTHVSPGGGGQSGADKDEGKNVGAIVAGVIAGALAVTAAYLGFCVWMYRKRLALYRNHVAMAQRAQGDPAKEGLAFFPVGGGELVDSEAQGRSLSQSQSGSGSGGSGGSGNIVPGNGSGGSGSGSGSGQTAIASGGTSYKGYQPVDEGSFVDGRLSTGSMEDLLGGQVPSFWGSRGVVLNPRSTLRVINRD